MFNFSDSTKFCEFALLFYNKKTTKVLVIQLDLKLTNYLNFTFAYVNV